MVQFLQINLHHSKAASAALLIRLATGNIDVVLIQEPWIVCYNICGFSTPLYKLFYTKRKVKTRTCILTKTHFNAFLTPQFSEGDLTTVRLELNEHTHHTIASFYLAHDHDGPLPNTITQQLIHAHSSKELILGTLTHKTRNGEVQTQTKGVSYSTTISFNQIYSSVTKVMTQLLSLEIGGKS